MAENKGFNIHNIHIYRKYTRYYFESKVTNQLICFIVGTTHFLVMLLFVKRIQVCIFWIKLLLHVYWHLHTFSYKKYFYNAVLTFLWFCIKNINHGNVSCVKLNGLIFFLSGELSRKGNKTWQPKRYNNLWDSLKQSESVNFTTTFLD